MPFLHFWDIFYTLVLFLHILCYILGIFRFIFYLTSNLKQSNFFFLFHFKGCKIFVSSTGILYFSYNLFFIFYVLPKYFYFFLIFIISNTITVRPQNFLASEPIKPCTCCVLVRKNVSALGARSGLVTLANLCESQCCPTRENAFCSVLVSFSAHHEF